VSVIVILPILSCSSVFGNERDSFNAQSDQTLYFQTIFSDYWSGYYWWLMNTSMPSGQASPLYITNNFISPHLAQSFAFQTITTTIYHEEVLAGRGTYTLTIILGFIDANGMEHVVTFDSATMDAGSTVTSLTTTFNTLLLEQERLYVQVSVSSSLSLNLQLYWGNSTYPSRISYQGTAVFVPEFPSFIFIPIFMIATLLAVIFYKRRLLTRKQRRFTSARDAVEILKLAKN